MKRTRLVILDHHTILGEEIGPEEFYDVETFRSCATQWQGTENVLILRNATFEDASPHDKVDYLLIDRAQIRALGAGTMSLKPGVGQVVGLSGS